ncbi:MAG: DUF2085 domain-containing protein [Geodermatophilaceae bacterium]|nr:DUF2085 domain-containing protein [Geodermatophilaceae bacterium]
MEWEQLESVPAKPPMSPRARRFIVGVQRGAAALSRHWLFWINGFWALLVVGSLLPPVLMALGMSDEGGVVYAIYSFTCHQLPERSFFLFGPDSILTTYSQPEVVAAGADPTTLLTLRQYVGSPELGWKLGFSDRMVTMYGGAFLGGVLFWLGSRRRPMQPISIWLLLLLLLPMAVDGTSHLVSEVTNLGFRDSNAWAVPLFGTQPDGFYTGTALGTLNSTLRLVTGLLFGMGMMLFAYPLMAYGFDDLADEAEQTLARNRVRLAMDR